MLLAAAREVLEETYLDQNGESQSSGWLVRGHRCRQHPTAGAVYVTVGWSADAFSLWMLFVLA